MGMSPKDLHRLGLAANRFADAFAIASGGFVVFYGFAEREMPKWKRAAHSGTVTLKSWMKKKLRMRSERKEVTEENSEVDGQLKGIRPDQSRWASTAGMVNLSTASPAEYIRAELWCSAMQKFSRGEASLETVIESYRAALKRLGIASVKDGNEVEDRRGREKDEEILRILRASYE